MTKYNSLKLKFSNSQLNNVKSWKKIWYNEVTSNFLSNMIGASNDETNFPHKLLLTDRQVPKLSKSFAKNNQKLNFLKLCNQEIFLLTSWTITKNWFSLCKKCS